MRDFHPANTRVKSLRPQAGRWLLFVGKANGKIMILRSDFDLSRAKVHDRMICSMMPED
jgi:hypothetical protein